MFLLQVFKSHAICIRITHFYHKFLKNSFPLSFDLQLLITPFFGIFKLFFWCFAYFLWSLKFCEKKNEQGNEAIFNDISTWHTIFIVYTARSTFVESEIEWKILLYYNASLMSYMILTNLGWEFVWKHQIHQNTISNRNLL